MVAGVSGISPYSYIYGHYGSMRTSGVSQITRVQPVQRTGAAPVVKRASNIGMPVEPIRPIGAVNANAASGVSYAIPFLRKGMDPAELAVRMRIQYGDGASAGKSDAIEDEALDASAGADSARKTMEEGECKTCEQRKYQDGSNDAGVSYKTPTHISPEQAGAAVRGHEMEHVSREQAKAVREGREVISQSVTVHTSICPECGTAYISGGTTRTVTAESQKAVND